MARLIRHSSESIPLTTRKAKQTSIGSSRDIHTFVQSHEFPLRLPKLSALSPIPSEATSPEIETVMLLSQNATKKLSETKARDSLISNQPRTRNGAIDTMLKPHFCETPSNRTSLHVREVRALPTTFEELVEYQQKVEQRRSLDRSSQCPSPTPLWSLPFSRKDAELLIQWMDEMLAKLVLETSLDSYDLFRYAKGVYSICLDEALVQIGAYCKELGMLLERVWVAYLGLLEKAIGVSKVEIAKAEDRYCKELDRVKSKAAVELQYEQKRVSDLTAKCASVTAQLREVEGQLADKDESEQAVKSKYMLLQSVYEDTKMKNLTLREEIRVLKIKLENALLQIQESDQLGEGALFTPGKRVKVRSEKELKLGNG